MPRLSRRFLPGTCFIKFIVFAILRTPSFHGRRLARDCSHTEIQSCCYDQAMLALPLKRAIISSITSGFCISPNTTHLTSWTMNNLPSKSARSKVNLFRSFASKSDGDTSSQDHEQPSITVNVRPKSSWTRAERHKQRYAEDPEFRERKLERNRVWHSRMLEIDPNYLRDKRRLLHKRKYACNPDWLIEALKAKPRLREEPPSRAEGTILTIHESP